MVYTHHSHMTCDDCGTKHIPGNSEACIETLKEQIAELEAANFELKRFAETIALENETLRKALKKFTD